MIPYWALFFMFVAGTLFSGVETSRPQSRLLLRAAAIIAILMIGLRFRVGGDWGQYLRIFRQISLVDLGQAFSFPNSDPAYSILNWAASQVGLGIWFVNLVCGAALVAGIMSIAVRQPNPWLVFVAAVPYLIIVVGMGYTRQSAAIGFTMMAINSMLDRRIVKALVLTMIAALFHQTAVILVPIIGIALSHNRVLTVILSACLAVLLYHFLVSARIDAMSRNYLGAQLDSSGTMVRLVITLVPATIFLLSQRHFGFDPEAKQVWRALSLAALCAAVAFRFIPSSTVVDRLALYLIPVQLVVLARVPWAFGGKPDGRLLLMMLVIMYCAAIQFVWLNYAVNAYAWVPYRFYLFSY